MLWAQAAGGLPWTSILNYGPFGIILILLLLGWLFPKPMIDHLLRDNERVRDENTALRASIEEKVTPALVRVTDLLAKVSERGM